MQYTIKGPAINFSDKLSIKEPVLLIGSCFAEHIGKRLADDLFITQTNPFGIVYNPLSITKQLNRIIDNTPYTADDLFEQNGIWHSWDHHSEYSSTNQLKILEHINFDLNLARTRLRNNKWLVITLGSAYYYEYNSTQEIVSNCHKVPGALFTKKMSTVAQIVDEFNAVLAKLKSINPKLNVLFSVSPVRYLRDGLIENTRSKSTLHLAIAEIIALHKNYHYFPAFEIVIDELRDYRFYEKDMLHPNSVAIEYVYDLFIENCVDEEGKLILKRWSKIKAAMNHRFLLNDSKEAIDFKKNTNKMMEDLLNDFPFLRTQLKNDLSV